jgi:hypothetical protein
MSNVAIRRPGEPPIDGVDFIFGGWGSPGRCCGLKVVATLDMHSGFSSA